MKDVGWRVEVWVEEKQDEREGERKVRGSGR